MTRYDRCFITIDTCNLAYVDIRPNLDKLILFIHGNSNSADLWRPQLSSHLFNDYRLMAIDLPAHGLSGEAAHYGIAYLGDLVAKFINTVIRPIDVTLVGLSLGGNVVSELLRSIASPKGVVIISSALVGDEIKVSDIPANELVSRVLFSDSASADEIDAYFDGVLKKGTGSEKSMLMEDYLRVSPVFRQAYPRSIQRGEYSNEIALIRNAGTSVLLVTGLQDDIIPPGLMANVSLPLWNNTRFTFQHSGHFPNVDEAERFNELLFAYVDAIHSRL